MVKLRRRELFKIAGLTAAGAALPGCDRELHSLIPYLLPDAEIVPGVANWYASGCRECEAGCGVIVRVMEGRAKKIEGNPGHPVNRGKLCARGQAALQGLYNPDRIRGPLKREAVRGEGKFRSVTWEEGIGEWAEQLRRHEGRAAMISRPLPGCLGDLFSAFFQGIGGKLLYYDAADEPALRAAVEASFGLPTYPHYDLAHTDYLLSFGAPFLETWLSPVSFGISYGEFRQGRPGRRGQFVQIEPRLSLTAANADRWVSVRPGTEGLLAMAIGRIILQEAEAPAIGASRRAYEKFYFGASLDEVAAVTQVAKDQIVRMAREFYGAAAPLAIGGGMIAAHTNSTISLMAIHGLNALVGNINKPGGLQFIKPGGWHPPPIAGERHFQALAKEVESGGRTMLMLYDANPVFTLPPMLGFQRVVQQVDFIVSFSSFMDESTHLADLILPGHTPLESWGDHRTSELASRPAMTLGQPVVNPLYDTREIGDVFLDAAQRLGGTLSERLAWPNFLEMLKAQWKEFLAHQEPAVPFEAAWVERLQQGGWWAQEAKPATVRRVSVPPPFEQASFSGEEKEFPFYFYPFRSLSFGDGHGANRPWLQELPDTLTSAMWGSWVEINPGTARAQGLRQGDIARVISAYGSVEAPVVYFPGMRPDLLCIPLGQGHTAYGRYAQGRGVNPLSLLGPLMDPRAGAVARGSTRVRIERVRGGGKLVVLDLQGQDPLRQSLQQKGDL
jgi:anaerobic selenocysteine-containing dehydrogenase